MHFYVNPHVLLTFDRAKQEIRIVEEEYEGFEVFSYSVAVVVATVLGSVLLAINDK